ncbi:glycosyl hydrolase [Aliiglaciecola sp. 3_MG-2023]|uniref:glycosyl hydrolase n=1 Tax=Aliiglaciecola sp. 3_MG-2023 TaxID=3062644 RepID=UPI0026E2CEA5|nr:glycosyl hydrolase [Aliiglaciecola sp. 3_MG-2023]MDO6693291.1 glycosyl hydrolase [Aliiglaciecola sp. 3_MG-2023]
MKFRSKLKYSVVIFTFSFLLSCTDEDVASPQATINNNSTSESSIEHKNAAEIFTSLNPDALQHNFQTPPHETKPLTWYHVMNANMSKEGITKDLEAMADAGIGGTILFNIGLNMPKGKVLFNSEQHIELIGHMAAESKRLGLSFGLHNCDGWSSSGGPWVTPEHSMKQVTWNETVVQSHANNGGKINLHIPQPMTMLDYYQDIAVLAYPSLESELIDAQLEPKISASDPDFDVSVVSNIEVMNMSSIKSHNGQAVWLQFSYDKPVTIRFASMDINFGKHIKYELQYSNDGKNFQKHVDLKVNRPGRIRWALDGAFEGITAKHFRIVANKTLNIYEASLSSIPRVGNYLGRMSATRTDYNQLPENIPPSKQDITDPSTIINLSDKLSETGNLTTSLPPGNWTIMRFGYTAKGTTNIPPTPEGRGLEVDKYSRTAFKAHYDAYVTNVINKVNQVAPGVMHSLEIDSYEVGGQNWTQGYEEKFKQQYDYELVPFLPLFAGKFIDTPATTESVLWDIRDLNNQLITKNYYQYFTELANADGIKTYIEPYGIGPFNDLDAGSKADIPMGEFWLKRNIYMIQSSTSAGHIYDKNVISAEAFTALPEHNWRFNPAYAKYDGDFSWALGINQFVFHRFVHQANTHVVPGITMERWGAHIDATQPWFATAGKDWMTYLSRGQLMLRQGQPVSDVLWYVGDAAPTTCPDRRHNGKNIPTNINYDCLNREKLQDLYFENGRYQLAHGVKYKVLKLNNNATLYFDSVKKIHQFATQGGVIIGTPIKQLAGRNITPEQQQQFSEMVEYIWSQPNTHLSVKNEAEWKDLYKKHRFNYDLQVEGLDNLYYAHRKTSSQDIYFLYNDSDQRKLFDATFAVSGKIPELWDARTGQSKKLASFKENNTGTRLTFRLDPNESTFVVFQQSAKGVKSIDPELLREHDIEVSYTDRMELTVSSKTNKTFNLLVNGQEQSVSFDTLPKAQTLNGSWKVTFLKQYGLEKTVTFDRLTHFKDHSDPEIQAYSGISIYEQSFDLSKDMLVNKQKVILDLGQVDDSAQVFINGVEAGIVWIAPFSLDVTSYLIPGKNDIRIEVASSWTNRMITDENYPDTSEFWQSNGKPESVMPTWYTNNEPLPMSGKKGHRMTFTTYKFVNKGDPLVSSGLLGPVTLTPLKTVEL